MMESSNFLSGSSVWLFNFSPRPEIIRSRVPVPLIPIPVIPQCQIAFFRRIILVILLTPDIVISTLIYVIVLTFPATDSLLLMLIPHASGIFFRFD